MKPTTKSKVILGAATLAAIGTILYLRYNRKQVKRKQERLERVSEEGYEFAPDILYPPKRHPLKRIF